MTTNNGALMNGQRCSEEEKKEHPCYNGGTCVLREDINGHMVPSCKCARLNRVREEVVSCSCAENFGGNDCSAKGLRNVLLPSSSAGHIQTAAVSAIIAGVCLLVIIALLAVYAYRK